MAGRVGLGKFGHWCLGKFRVLEVVFDVPPTSGVVAHEHRCRSCDSGAALCVDNCRHAHGQHGTHVMLLLAVGRASRWILTLQKDHLLLGEVRLVLLLLDR